MGNMANKKHIDFNAIERFLRYEDPEVVQSNFRRAVKSFENDQLMKDMRKVIVSKDKQRM